MIYREMKEIELHLALFEEFQRTQVVEQCWRKVAGTWKLQTVPFLDDWDQREQEELIANMKRIKAQHGFVYGAFLGNLLKGFVAVEGERMGSRSQYLDLLYLYVSQELRNQGIGRTLFYEAVAFAQRKGVNSLYLSAHSAMETQAFYRAMGCVEAQEVQAFHVMKEPFDCQLEYEIIKKQEI